MEPDGTLDWLRAAVAVMRELGVVRWNGIELGASPPVVRGEMSDEDRAKRADAAEQQRMRVQFAHSRVVPKVRAT